MIIIKKISPTAFLVHGSYGPFLRMNRSGFSKRGNACAVYIYNNNCRRRISYGNRMTGFFTSLFEIETCNYHLTVTILPYLWLINICLEPFSFEQLEVQPVRIFIRNNYLQNNSKCCEKIPDIMNISWGYIFVEIEMFIMLSMIL